MPRRITRISWSFGLLCCVGTLRGQTQEANPFDRYDANKDGKVLRDEVPERLRQRFDAIDANKDGTITGEEQRAYLIGP